MHAKGIPEPVGANASRPTGVWIHQIWQASPSGTVSHYLPGPVPVKTKDKHRAITGYLILTEIVLQNRPGYVGQRAMFLPVDAPAGVALPHQLVYHTLGRSGVSYLSSPYNWGTRV